MRGVFTKRQTVCEQGSSFGQCSGVLLNRPGFSVNEDDGDKILTEASWASEKGFLEIFAVDWNGVDSRSGLPLTPVVKVKDFNHYFFYNYLLFSSLPITAEEILYGAHVGEKKILKLEPHVAITVGSSHDIEHRGWIPRIGEKIERFRILQV